MGVNRAAIYTRISVTKEDHDSVATQETNLQRLAEANDYEVVKTYTDDGISAYSGKARPGWLKLREDMKAGMFDVILAVAEDRLSRGSEEKMGFQSECIRAHVTWHTIAGGKLNPATAQGGMLATITGAVAQHESAMKIERIRQRRDEELANGRPLWGSRGFGFEKDRLTHVSEEAEAIRWAYKRILEGGSLYSVARHFNTEGILTVKGGKWNYQTVRRMLERPRNAGILTENGQRYENSLIPPIVSEETLDQFLAIVNDSRRETRPGPKVVKHMATGLALCGKCSAVMRSGGQSMNGVRVPVYRCSMKTTGVAVGERHVTVQASQLDAKIKAAIVESFVSGRAMTSQQPGSGKRAAALRAEVAEMHRQRQTAQEIATMPGADLAHLKTLLAGLAQKEATARAELDGLIADSAVESMLNDVILRVRLESEDDGPASYGGRSELEMSQRWDALSIEHKRQLITSLLRITVDQGRTDKRIHIEQLKPAIATVNSLRINSAS